MGKRNRERRAAKAKERARRQRSTTGTGPTGRFDWSQLAPSTTPPVRELVEGALLAAAEAHWSGDAAAAGRCGRELTDGRFAEQSRVVETAVSMMVGRMVRAVWDRSWLPHDLFQLVRRRLGARAASYVVDAMAADADRYAPATVPERWRDQLHQVDATIWWRPDAPHLGQWIRRHGCDRGEAIAMVVELLATAMSMPVLTRILPLPGTVRDGRVGPRRHVDQRVLARVRGLLAKAEATEFSEEAETLSAKAQELMSRHALERAVVEADQSAAPQPATARRLWLDSPYLGAKALLVDAIAAANRCRSVLSEQLGFVTVIGDEVDLEIVELLTTSLLVQATKTMVAAGRQTSRHGQSRTRSYRQSFLVAYATRIGERLTAASDAGSSDVADPQRLLPVLAARERVVDELYEQLFPSVVGRSYSVNNVAGWYAGRAAADLARLDALRAVQA